MEDAENSLGKRKYFGRLAMEMRAALKLHKKAGLWERRNGERDWGNVSEHCLVEVARSEVFASLLHLPDDVTKDMKIAAALHDFFKKGEKEIAVAEGLSWDSFEKASRESTRHMKEAGFDERIVRLANSAGHGSFVETENIVGKETLSPEEVGYLVLHYIDDYTVGSQWTTREEMLSDGRTYVNDLDRRVDMNEGNERYARLNEEGRSYFHGGTTFEMQRRIGNLVEERLARLISEKEGQPINPKGLPHYIDKEIQKRIRARKV